MNKAAGSTTITSTLLDDTWTFINLAIVQMKVNGDTLVAIGTATSDGTYVVVIYDFTPQIGYFGNFGHVCCPCRR